jgi:hypothetical protein
MKRVLLIISICLIGISSFSQAPLYGMQDVEYSPGRHMLVKLPPDYGSSGSKKYPLLMNFHGNGELPSFGPITILFNAGYPKRVKDGKLLYPLNSFGQPIYYISVSPQDFASGGFSDPNQVQAVWNYVINNYRVDTTKNSVGKYKYVVKAGYSQGAADVLQEILRTWQAYGFRQKSEGKFFIGSTPFLQEYDSLGRLKDSKIVGFVGELESPYRQATTDIVNYVATLPGSISNLIIVPGADHSNLVWDSMYSAFNSPSRNIYRYLVDDDEESSNIPTGPNQPPVVNAGSDQTFDYSFSSLVVANASDPDGTIVSYLWSKVSGGQANIVSPNSSATYINSFMPGQYTFRVTVTDDQGNTAFDDVVLNVTGNGNLPPTARAGNDQTITFPSTSTSLNGTASTDVSPGTIQFYHWNKISGPGATIVSPDSATTAVSGLSGGVYTFQLVVTDNQGATSSDNITVFVNGPPDPNASVPIYPYQIYDLTDYASGKKSELMGGNSPWDLFNGFGLTDPKNGNFNVPIVNGKSIVASALPWRFAPFPRGTYRQTAFRGNRGLRLILDLTGDKDEFNLKKVLVSDIWGVEASGDSQDTLYCYNFDSVFYRPVEDRPDMVARPDSLMTPFAKLVVGEGGRYGPTWRNVSNLSDSMRYMMIRFVPKDRGPGWTSTADFGELVIYARKLYNPDSVHLRPQNYAGPYPAPKAVKNVLGVNNTGASLPQMKYDGFIRNYTAFGYYEDGSNNGAKWPLNHYNFNRWNFGSEGFTGYGLAAKQNGQFMWESIRGTSQRMEDLLGNAMGATVNVDSPFAEPERPQSYYDDGDFYRHYAAKWGDSIHSNLSSFRFYNDAAIPGTGLNYYQYVENGNEDEFFGTTIAAYVSRSMVDYDGWENRIKGPGNQPLGIKAGSKNFKLLMCGTVYLDSNRIRSMHFLSRLYRTDHKIVWEIANSHHYSRTYNRLSYSPTYELMVGGKGESPEKDSVGYAWDKYRQFYYNDLNGDTSFKIILSEWGYDNFSIAAPDVTYLSWGWTTSGTPMIPGLDSVQSKGIIMNRGESIFMAKGMWGYNEFSLLNGQYWENNSNYLLFGTTGRGGRNPNMDVKFANYWTRASFFTALGEYKAEALLSEGGPTGLWLIKWRHQTKPDSVCYEAWKGSYNGTTLPSTVISMGNIFGQVNQRAVSYTTDQMTSNIITPAGSTVTLTVTEIPTYLFVKESTSGNVAPIASAGNDVTITLPNTVTLNAGGSSDPDGSIVLYQWIKLSGPSVYSISNVNSGTPVLSNLQPGTYVFQVTVTDNIGAVSSDTVTVIVNASQAPPSTSPVQIKKVQKGARIRLIHL